MSMRRRLFIACVSLMLLIAAVALGASPAGAAAPPNVTGLTATPLSPTSVRLNWTNPTGSGFTGVHICRAYGAVAPTSSCAGVNVTSPTHTYTDSNGLIPNTEYTYAVFAGNASAQLASGAHITVTTPQAPAPANVSGLTATPVSPTSITLNWTNPTSNFAGVYICRAVGSVAPTSGCAGVKVLAPTHTYTDSNGLIPNTKYTYTVFAGNASGALASGVSVSATTLQAPAPANVTGLTATPLSSTSIKLKWTNPTSASFAGVYICRTYGSVAPTMPCGGVAVAAPAATYTDSYQLLAGFQYTYTVFASTASGVTATGTSVTVTTP
jgi:hypothetical protein